MKLLLSLLLTLAAVNAPIAAADANSNGIAVVSYSDDESKISPCLFTSLWISLNETDGANVKAVLENSFTLFPSMVAVDLWLYSSTEKTSDLNKMTLEGTNSSEDLNMGESLTVVASTHNEDRYWVGYAIYYKSSTDTQTYQTDPKFFYADGTYNPAK